MFVIDESVYNLYDKDQTFSYNEPKQIGGKRGPTRAMESTHKRLAKTRAGRHGTVR
jgi:hypothetical protein